MKKEADYIQDNNERWIVAPFSSTAEMQAKMFYSFARKAIHELVSMKLVDMTVWAEGAIVHETDTGYADYRASDGVSCMYPEVYLKDIKFSEGCMKDWPSDFKNFYNKLLDNERNLLGT